MGILQEAAKRVLREEFDVIDTDRAELREALATVGTNYGLLAEEHGALREDKEALRIELDALQGEHLQMAAGYETQRFEVEELRESMSELALYLEDRGWMRLSGQSEAQMLSRSVIGTVAEDSRVLYLKNPLIQRGANVKRLYVWGQGMSVKAKDPEINQVIQAFMDDRRNRLELTAHQARMLKEIDLQCDGNLFFVLFVNPSTGYVRLGSVPFSQVRDIISNPEDAKEIWYYLREWTETVNTLGDRMSTAVTGPRKAYYRDWYYVPVDDRARINGVAVNPGLVYHVKVGSFSDWKWGMSEHLAAQDWALAYKDFLQDWASIVRAYRRFAWKYSGAKSATEIAAVKAKVATTVGTDTSETNPASVTGALATLREGRDLTPIRTAGATVAAEDGRRLLLMVAATEGLPETFFGDVSVGTLATATSMDRPTELMMKDRQLLWADVHKEMFNFVVLQAVKATSGPLRGKGRYMREKFNGRWEEWIEWSDVDPTMDIDFPPMLESSVKEGVEAVVHGATLGGLPSANTIPLKDVSRMILQKLGAEDIDAILEQLYPEEGEGIGEYNPEQGLQAAAREFREALDTLIDGYAKPK